MGGISVWQLLIIAVIVVLLFGTKKLRVNSPDSSAFQPKIVPHVPLSTRFRCICVRCGVVLLDHKDAGSLIDTGLSGEFNDASLV